MRRGILELVYVLIADLSVTISRADFEASDEKEFEAVRGKQRKSLTLDDYHPASEYK